MFKLYPTEQHWWSFQDYGAVLSAVEHLRAKRILEFGPGSSTLALIEGGATHVDTCEDDPHWAGVYEERLQAQFPDIVHVHRYSWADPVEIPTLREAKPYDLALIDGPRDTSHRRAVVDYCLARAAAVLVPMESPGFRQYVTEQAEARGLMYDVHETGPLAGSFMLITPPAQQASEGGEEHGENRNRDFPGDPFDVHDPERHPRDEYPLKRGEDGFGEPEPADQGGNVGDTLQSAAAEPAPDGQTPSALDPGADQPRRGAGRLRKPKA